MKIDVVLLIIQCMLFKKTAKDDIFVVVYLRKQFRHEYLFPFEHILNISASSYDEIRNCLRNAVRKRFPL